jgi:hypothetical protein
MLVLAIFTLREPGLIVMLTDTDAGSLVATA